MTPEYLSIRSELEELVRGEVNGATGPIEPSDAAWISADLPMRADQYDFNGLHIYSGEDHEFAVSAAQAAHESNIGNNEFRALHHFVTSQVEFSRDLAIDWMVRRGYPELSIKRMATWYDQTRAQLAQQEK